MGATIRDRREAERTTQNALSKLVGVSPHTINHIERGWTRTPDKPIRPQRETVVKLAEVLDLDLNKMLDVYGLTSRTYAQFNIAGLTAADVEKVKRFIDGLRKKK